MSTNGQIGFSSPEMLNILKCSADGKSDLLFRCKVMPKFAEITKAALYLDCNVLVFLPNAAVIPELLLNEIKKQLNVICIDTFSSDSEFYIKNRHKNILCFADVRLLNEDRFWRFAEFAKFEEFFVLFADCARAFEYGYRYSYSLIAEFRASQKEYIHTCIFCNQIDEKQEDFLNIFGCSEILGIQEEIFPLPVNFIACKNTKERYKTIFEQYKTDFCGKSAVIFQTRRELFEFLACYKEQINDFAVFHGGLDAKKRKQSINDFYTGKKKILLATKSVFASFLGIFCDNVFLCGLAYSSVNLLSVYSLFGEVAKDIQSVYCADDIALMKKLSLGAAQFFDFENTDEFLKNRFRELDEIINNIP